MTNRKLNMKLLLLASLAVASSQAFAFDVFTSGHFDIGAAIDDGEMHPHIHSHTGGGTEYEVDEAAFWAKDNHLETRASGSQWDFIGVSSGQSYYRLPQNNQSGKLYIGFGVEEIDPGSVDSYTISDPRVEAIYGTDPAPFITWQLVSVVSSTGGAFSVWNGSSSVDPVWISSADGIGSTDFFAQQAGGHDHVNYGFSKAGLYDITFNVATMVGNNVVEKMATYHFGIGDNYQPVAPVPEPATMTVLGFGCLMPFLRRRKSR